MTNKDNIQLLVFDYNTGKPLLGSIYMLNDQLKRQFVMNEGGWLYEAAGIKYQNMSAYGNGRFKVGYDVSVGPAKLILRSSESVYSISISSNITANSTTETK